MPPIAPFLWFDGQAEEAVAFYTSVFPNSSVDGWMRGPDGSVMGANFRLDGQPFMALNGGPLYQFTPAVSFFVSCETQAEVDRYWSALGAGSDDEGQCGWLKDRFGVSWQIIPTALGELLGDPDPEKAGRVMQAMLGMKKIEIAGLREAHEGR